MQTKPCRVCNQQKDLSEFHGYHKAKDGKMSRCKKCDTIRVREMRYKKLYGIDPETYSAMYDEQSGRCLICGTWYKLLCVDHSHSTGKVRGLLCRGCNYDLGKYERNPEMLDGMIAYIQTNL